MKKLEYRSILGQLPIKNPTVEDMARLCPHLRAMEALEAFTSGNGYVACPSLLIKHSFQVLHYTPERVSEGKNYPSQISSAYAKRTRQSYVDGQSHGDVFFDHQYMKQAVAFSEKNWGKELILDDWDAIVSIYIQDPTDLVNDRYHHNYPRTNAVLNIALKRDLNKIVNDHTKPQSVLFDEAISQMTLDDFVWKEIKGGRGGYTEFNCANCGAGLSLTNCPGCGHKFNDDLSRCSWYTPLSPKMIAFLRDNGHVFGIDPEIALNNERSHWKPRK